MARRRQVQTAKRTVCPPPCLSASSVSVFLSFFFVLNNSGNKAAQPAHNNRHQWPRNQHPCSPPSPCPVNGIFPPLVALATKQHNRCTTCPRWARTAKVTTTPSHYHPPTCHHINPIASGGPELPDHVEAQNHDPLISPLQPPSDREPPGTTT